MATYDKLWTSDGNNGIFDFLGKDKDTTSWAHPETTRGYVTTSQSTTNVHVSANALNQATNGSLTNNAFDQWWKADFGASAGVKVTRIGIKGWSATGTIPRNYYILGSVDGKSWEILYKTVATGPIGDGWYTEAVTNPTTFRYIKVLNYGLDSYGANYLCLGEVELWGTYNDSVTHTAPTPPSTGELEYTSDQFDGIIDFLGHTGDPDLYLFSNPDLDLGYVDTSQSTTYGSPASGAVAQRVTGGYISHTDNYANSWWKIDLGADNTALITRLGIHGKSYTGDEPRNFLIQGSNNDTDWDTLATIVSDGPAINAWWSTAIATETEYRYFRIYQNGANSSGRYYLALGSVEMWGEYNPQPPPAPVTGDDWHTTRFQIEIATGALATEIVPGGEWDIDDWDDATDALWGGSERVWTDITDDYVSLKTKRGRAKWGTHYTAGSATLKLWNGHGLYSPTQPIEADINLTIGTYVRISAIHNYIEYPVFTGTVRSVDDPDTPGKVPVTTVQLVDAFSFLAGVNRIAVSAVGASEKAGARLGRLLDDIAWPDDQRSLGTGVETLQATTKAGNLLTEMYLVADSEGGELYVDRDGNIVFLDRAAADALAAADPLFTVAGYPDPANNAPWLCWATMDTEYSLDRVRNHVSIGRVGGTVQVDEDTDSINAYGKRTVVRTDLLNESDTWPAALATRIVANRKDVHEQIDKVTLTAGNKDETAAVLAAELGDPIRSRRIIGVDPDDYEVDANALIQGIGITAKPAGERTGVRRDEWAITFALDDNYTPA
ncbi:MAG: hypothetical protein DWP92_01640 [Armatimonadetes bacterium]|nr:MAG: hypothetical protein DWP92_01640 [Armatimonadota bacterium]